MIHMTPDRIGDISAATLRLFKEAKTIDDAHIESGRGYKAIQQMMNQAQKEGLAAIIGKNGRHNVLQLTAKGLKLLDEIIPARARKIQQPIHMGETIYAHILNAKPVEVGPVTRSFRSLKDQPNWIPPKECCTRLGALDHKKYKSLTS